MSEETTSANAPWLIVGLGNPGARHAGTRHNAGFMAVEELAVRNGLRFAGRQAVAEIAKGVIEGHPVILAKPQTYMNNSWQAVGALARYYKIPHNRVFVVYDEIALPLGVLRIREKGSSAGHNGLNSIIQHLGTQAFPRLRIGVDRPVAASYDRINWVLGHFSRQEQAIVDEAIPRAAEAIEAVLRLGIERAMNEYNAKRDDDDEPGKTGRDGDKGDGELIVKLKEPRP